MADCLHRSPSFVATAILVLILANSAYPEVGKHADDGSHALFETESIQNIWLNIPKPSWQKIDDEALSGCAPHNRAYYPGTIRFDDAEFSHSGVRAKGGCGSSRTLDGKTAFKAHLSWDDPAVPGCAETRRYKGLKRFTFNNQVEDASYTHERIGYDFLKQLGVTVPRAAPVKLHVNDAAWGLYLHVETIDRRFLSRHFESNDGMLYEADYGCDIGETGCFESKFKTDECDEPRDGDPTDKTPLENLHLRLSRIPDGDFYPAIETIFDFDTFLSMWAATAVMGYWDGYPNDPNNYRIYHDPSNDRWTLIPTGTDQLFEKNVDPFDPVGVLGKRCLAEEDCEAVFHARLEEVAKLFEAADYPSMVRKIARQIEPEVAADTRREFSLAEWREAIEATIRYMERRPGEIQKLLLKSDVPAPRDDFYFHALKDPTGERFIYVTWMDPGSAKDPGVKWFTAKGYFEQLTANLDAIRMTGGSSAGLKIGDVVVDFVDCGTAAFTYTPINDPGNIQSRVAKIDSEIWKYCD
jgi:hypothetical protein